MPRTLSRLLSAGLITVPMLWGATDPARAQSAEAGLLDRGLKGDATVNGGARRLAGDITDAFRAEIKGGPARNVILLIGDGMGDSEITIARNVALGAGGAFAGIDALPVTGQYTH